MLKSFNCKLNHSLVLFIFGVLLLVLRYTDPFLNPILYAEDGVWVGQGLSYGWINTVFHARSDYFTVYNILGLYISTIISSFFTGNPLILLPQSIALVSFSFYSLISVLVFNFSKRSCSLFISYSLYVLVLFLPLGSSQSEILGRLLQIGFYMPVFSLCIFEYMRTSRSKLYSYMAAVMIFLAAATNPVVVPIIYLMAFFDIFGRKGWRLRIKSYLPLLVSLLIISLIIAKNIHGQGGINLPPNYNNYIEMVFARQILYPFVFPWYHELSDTISLIIFFFYSSYCILCYSLSRNILAKHQILFVFISLVIYCAATSIGRSGLSSILDGYSTTFPDRYFMGVNILSLILFVLCTAQLFSSIKFQWVGSSVVALLLSIYAFNYNDIMQRNVDKQRIGTIVTFQEQLCSSTLASDGYRKIQIYPLPTWSMSVPNVIFDNITCVK